MINKLQINFFYILLIIVFVLTVIIFFPYFEVLFLAIVLAVTFQGFYRHVKKFFGKYDSLAAFVSVIVILVLILLPLTILGFYFFKESRDLYVYLTEQNEAGNSPLYTFMGNIQIYLDRVLPDNLVPESTTADVEQYASKASGWLIGHFQNLFSSVISLVVDLFILLLGLFFFLRDGHKFADIIVKVSPLSDSYDQGIIKKMEIAINSVIRGNILIAIAQGVLATAGFLFFGVPSPILWGSLATVAALVPSIGTAIVILPVSLYLLSAAGTFPAVGLLLWGLLVVGLIDNLLRPFILERGIKIHPFLILLSVFGGIGFFGPIGFIAGPVILSLLFALVDIYPQVIKAGDRA
ncbi:MAG TPA: AI-2E family transporter [Candidatus Paceibacterota bacterium]